MSNPEFWPESEGTAEQDRSNIISVTLHTPTGEIVPSGQAITNNTTYTLRAQATNFPSSSNYIGKELEILSFIPDSSVTYPKKLHLTISEPDEDGVNGTVGGEIQIGDSRKKQLIVSHDIIYRHVHLGYRKNTYRLDNQQ